MSEIFVKTFKSRNYNIYSLSNFNYKLSDYISTFVPWFDFLKYVNLNHLHDMYVLCPTYTLKGKSDFQYEVTGKAATNDGSILYTISREMDEELGLTIVKEPRIFEYKTKDNKKLHYCFMDIENTKMSTEPKETKKGRDKKIRISSIIYGTRENMRIYCNSFIIRRFDEKEHRILTKATAMPITYMIDFVNRKILEKCQLENLSMPRLSNELVLKLEETKKELSETKKKLSSVERQRKKLSSLEKKYEAELKSKDKQLTKLKSQKSPSKKSPSIKKSPRKSPSKKSPSKIPSRIHPFKSKTSGRGARESKIGESELKEYKRNRTSLNNVYKKILKNIWYKINGNRS